MPSPARVLIIDDIPNNAQLLSQILKFEGYEHVERLQNPSLTLRRVRAFSPDLILLDLMMAGTDGYDVLTELRQIMPADGFLPVLVVTADHRVEARERALALGLPMLCYALTRSSILCFECVISCRLASSIWISWEETKHWSLKCESERRNSWSRRPN